MEFEDDYTHNYEENWNNDDISWQDNEMGGPRPGYQGRGNYQINKHGGFRGGWGSWGGFGRGRSGPPRSYEPRRPYGRPGPGPGPGPYTWGRGFGPDGPPSQQRFPKDNSPMKYLLRCGVPKDSLKGVPKTLLRLIEPEYCGVCGQGFDNITGSRLHYISKNHAKNQKKWLSQQAELGSHRSKEIPLKSRDLYCELCDVHITSKTHAISHYSGRPHRAIVEGRKQPKNPYLLQKGMQPRVDQLIRREKKNLKPLEEIELTSDDKKDKPVQSELVCEICKTSVTCTEQMTMHLNGKKHLSKEKQHILKMMKGESTDIGGKSAENVDATKEHKDATEDADKTSYKNDDEEGEDEYGWGNGGGAWDDDPQ